jgi:hypothetical protein
MGYLFGGIAGGQVMCIAKRSSHMQLTHPPTNPTKAALHRNGLGGAAGLSALKGVLKGVDMALPQPKHGLIVQHVVSCYASIITQVTQL